MPSRVKTEVELSVVREKSSVDEESSPEYKFDELLFWPKPLKIRGPLSHPPLLLQPRVSKHATDDARKQIVPNAMRITVVNESRPTVVNESRATLISDWGSAFDGLENITLTNRTNTIGPQGSLEDWSFVSEVYLTSNVPTLPVTRKINVQPGNVLVMQLTKDCPRFSMIKLESTMNELVESFLSTNNGGVRLPVSFTESEYRRPKLMNENRMAMSIRDNLGQNFNESTQGLLFSVGPLNTKLCYKMTLVDLEKLQNLSPIQEGMYSSEETEL
jgi:hypothetical protein